MSERPAREASSVGLLITLAAMVATAFLALTFSATLDVVRDDPARIGAFLFLTLLLQLLSIEVYGRGSISVSAIGLIAAGFSLGPGPALAIGFTAALLQWARRRGLMHRALFDAANLSLSAATAAFVYLGLTTLEPGTPMRIAAAIAAGIAYNAVNTGLLCLAMSLTEHLSVSAVWNERFRWLTPHYLAFGPLALASTIAYERVGLAGLLAFALPPALMILSVRQYLQRTRAAVEEVRRTNDELLRANAELASRNDDLHQLFDFAGGLAARAHDRGALVSYAESAIGTLTGGGARVAIGPSEDGVGLLAGGTRVGGLLLDTGEGFDGERWERIREAILPQLATAIESSELVERVRKMHLATIAALSRSMEAKDCDTGGHTERVSSVAVAIGRRLGYSGADLDAIEIGALLHDIGKIGIPERILHKPGQLDDDDWAVMREHPIVSEYILAGVDLPPIVLQIARSSHERIDGAGYPDGLGGDEIPLPARIVLVADAFDALTSDRPYRPGRPVNAAIEELRAHAGTQFCPTVMEALEAVYREEPQTLGLGTLRAVADVA